jgi:hemerythrin
MSFKWKEQYSVGVSEIDKQHKRLFELGAQIYDLAKLNDGFDHFDEIVDIIQELRDYTRYHFQSEEELMDKYQYPSARLHKLEHFSFIRKLNDLDLQEIDDDQNRAVIKLLDFVIDWIVNHITKSDHQYKQFFSEKGLN